MRVERLGRDRRGGQGDVLVAIEVPVALRHGERIVRVGEGGDEQERPPVVRPRDVEDRPLGGEGDLVVEVELVGAQQTPASATELMLWYQLGRSPGWSQSGVQP